MKCVFFDIDRTLIDLDKSNSEGKAVLFDDVIPCLERLKNFKLGVISNGMTLAQIKKLKETGIYKYFSFFVTAEEAGFSKPDRKIFKYACKKAKCHPEDAFYIGDKFENDANAAKAMGMSGVWLSRKNENLNSHGIIQIKSLSGFADIILDFKRANYQLSQR